jgi:2-hydroxychromene-2-carboxylate isomerase
MKLQFWFEFASTYSYPAALRVERVAAAQGVAVQWRAFLLGPIFRAQGLTDSPFNLNPAKGRYMWRDLQRICDAEGIPLRRPDVFPRNGLLAARVACRFSDAQWLPDFVRGVYRANFVEDLDISDPVVIAGCVGRCGQNAQEILDQAGSEQSKERLRERSQEAERLEIFGAPSFVVGNELFWGNDRLETAVEWASRH